MATRAKRYVTHTSATPATRPAWRKLYGRKWNEYSTAYLSDADHCFCVECAKAGVQTVATEVDHVIPHRGDQQLFWDHENHQPLCKPCHSRKTTTEDGGFGRAPKPIGSTSIQRPYAH